MRRPSFALALTLTLAVVSAGCLRSTTVVDLKPDGSGTIVQETALTAQALSMIKSMGNANEPGGKAGDIFDEQQARTAAAAMGVTFVSGEPFKANEMEGYRARFSFDDITKVKVNMSQNANMTGGTSKEPPFSFAFDRGAASSLLTIQMPQQSTSKLMPQLPGAGNATDPAEKAQAAQALTMMKMMMRGLFVDVTLNVNGRILKSNAPYVEGTRITLMQIDFDKLLADAGALERLQGASDLKAMANVPGLKVVSEPKLTIEIAR